MIIGGIDFIMLLSDFVYDRRMKRLEAAKKEVEAAKKEAKQEGIEEGREEGIEAGKAEVYQEVQEWDRRRKEAEERGEAFTEPLPTQPSE